MAACTWPHQVDACAGDGTLAEPVLPFQATGPVHAAALAPAMASQEQQAARSRVTRAANFPAAKNAGESALQAFILENLDLLNAEGNVAGSVSAAPVSIGVLLQQNITGRKRARAQGTGIQVSCALHGFWLLAPSRIELMLVQVMEHQWSPCRLQSPRIPCRLQRPRLMQHLSPAWQVRKVRSRKHLKSVVHCWRIPS
jgi:hypothetical protein